MSRTRAATRKHVQSALLAALLCIISPIAIPFGPVPVTLSIFVVMLTAVVLEWKQAASAVLLYLLLGIVGLPVFSGGAGGIGVLIGPTGGYIWCYLPMVLCVSIGAGKGTWRRTAFFSAASMILCYTLGTMQFMLVTGSGCMEALALCVWPFILFDAAKIAGAILLGRRLRHRLQEAELI